MLSSKNSGFSLIEVMIGMGIAAVLLGAMAQMGSNQTKTVKYLNQKLTILDTEKLLSTVLADGKVCTQILTAAPNTITVGSLGTYKINLGSIPVSTAAGAAALVQPGPVSSSGIVVTNPAVTIQNFQIATGTPNTYIADLTVNYDASSFAQPIRQNPTHVMITTNAGNVITSCNSNQGLPFTGSYQDMTASRAFGTSYTNTSSLPLFVTVTATSNNVLSQKYISAAVNAVVIQVSPVSDANAAMGWLANTNHLSFIVPPGQSYLITRSHNTVTLDSWMELK